MDQKQKNGVSRIRQLLLRLLGLDEIVVDVQRTLEYVKSVTTIDVDVAMVRNMPNTVIVCGRYRNSTYINVFDFRCEDFAEMVNLLRSMEKAGKIRHIDAAPAFRYTFSREI